MNKRGYCRHGKRCQEKLKGDATTKAEVVVMSGLIVMDLQWPRRLIWSQPRELLRSPSPAGSTCSWGGPVLRVDHVIRVTAIFGDVKTPCSVALHPHLQSICCVVETRQCHSWTLDERFRRSTTQPVTCDGRAPGWSPLQGRTRQRLTINAKSITRDVRRSSWGNTIP
ncbi:hypothetical protein BO78DRAFT_95308 [Aspergillus sclerotiicarbonarius CBS 121057]|uniref:Uncharacterized protein n=1 Tax=Aspergillus sclerotiicarbonarius (strain CBS 121057 / IBT 28362) TaxID=1448318 RepID=A0A319ECH1_ASPSB|nr:hypothetical protein BO78DRAFT_95308 [Aspergillus sclerotiicarbonarius CBS 121057]